MTRERKSRKQVTYTTSKRRRSFELRSGTSDKDWGNVKELAKTLADSERLGTAVPSGTMERVMLLPDYIKTYFAKDRLIEWAKSKNVPTLGVFLEEYGKSRPGKELMHKRLTSYLVGYFGVHKRLDEITPPKASGILSYWANDRKSIRKGTSGKLAKTTITKALTWVKSAFETAIKWGYLKRSPFEDVKCDNVETNKTRHCRVTLEAFNKAVACLDDVKDVGKRLELKVFLAINYFAGLRPSDIKDLRYDDIRPEPKSGRLVIVVPPTGKTGERRVPLFDSLRPFYDALVAAKHEGQVYLFEWYRTRYTSVGTLIKKKMTNAGLEPWSQFLTNTRRTRINEKREQGFSQQERTAVFGNSPLVRAKNYDEDLTLNDIALLGVENDGFGVAVPVGPPAVSTPLENSTEPETFEVVLSCFGLPNDERYFPTLFPTLSSDSASVWEMIDNGAGYQQVIVAALLRCGYSGKRAWTIAEKDKYAFDFYMDIKHCRELKPTAA